MLNFKPFQRLSVKQWWWLFSAYWRLWPTLLRIKLKQGAWLQGKISFAQADALRVSTIKGVSQQHYALALHESVRLAARLHFLNADCLPRSIVLADMLSSSSSNVQVIIGVNKHSQGIASHAWVELDGVMLAEPESVASDFTALRR